MDFRHLIVTCLFSKLRLPFDNQKVKENYAILYYNMGMFYCTTSPCFIGSVLICSFRSFLLSLFMIDVSLLSS